MQRLILLMIVVATTFDYLFKGDKMGRFGFLPREATYLAEILGVAALLYVVFVGTQDRFRYVRPAYLIIFSALLFTILAGIVLNRVEPGPMIAGIRTFLRAIPWIFIGAVVAFTENDIRNQLRLLLGIALIQIPLAIEQRLHGFSGELGYVSYTGDATTGTFVISSVLSLFLICCLCMLVAFYLRKRIKTQLFLLLFPALLTPTLINETKGTLVFLPIGLFVTIMAAVDPHRRIRAMLIASSLVIFAVSLYIPVDNYFGKESRPSIVEYYTNPEYVEGTLHKDMDIGSQEIRTTSSGAQIEKSAGRLDAILVPLRELSADPATLFFGLGIGNASSSALGLQYAGEHYWKFSQFMTHGFAHITLELGIFGLLLVIALLACIYSDSAIVSRHDDGFFGALAAGVAGATVVIALSLIYKDLITHISMSFLFWYFAGLVAAHRMRIVVASR
jgi:hypothetical protein